MINLKKIFGIALIFGMLGIYGLYAQTDRRLNGTWGMIMGGIEMEYVLNDGNYEFSTFMELLGTTIVIRGKYTTSGDTITFTPTHIHGAGIGLESRWLTQNEARAGFGRLLGMSAAEYDQQFGALWAVNTWTYTIKGNTISFSQPIIFTRR